MVEKDKKKNRFLKKLCLLNDNLLSFLCGILSSIPITLLLTYTKIGESCYERWNFMITLVAIIVSVALVFFAIKFTLCKIEKISPSLIGKGLKDKIKVINVFLDEKNYMPKNKNGKQITKKQFLLRPVMGFFICLILLLILIIAKWFFYNLI